MTTLRLGGAMMMCMRMRMRRMPPALTPRVPLSDDRMQP